MAILTGKPTSISAAVASGEITLDTSEFLNLVDNVTADQYWQDASRIKSIVFIYRNSSRQRVTLKFTLPSTSSTISLNGNYRNGALTCSKIKIIGMANDTLSIPRSSFTTDTEFDILVTGGYVPPTALSLQPISWIDPLTSFVFPELVSYVAEPDGGIYKTGAAPAEFNLSLPSTQGYIEIDAVRYTYTIGGGPSTLYNLEYNVGLSSGSRDVASFDPFLYGSPIDFALQASIGITAATVSSLQNGGNIELLPMPLKEPGNFFSPDHTQTLFKNKIRVQLKNGDVEYFVNNAKVKTLSGVLTSVATPIFAEVNLKNPYIEMGANSGSGFPSARISSTYSVPGTIIRTFDMAVPNDSGIVGATVMIEGSQRGPVYWTDYSPPQPLLFGEGTGPGGATIGASVSIGNIGSNYASIGEATFPYPLVEGNTYTIRIYIDSYTNSTRTPSLSVLSYGDNYLGIDPGMVTIPSGILQAAVGSFVEVSYTGAFLKFPGPPGFADIINDQLGLLIASNDTDSTNTISVSKIEIIEA
jgi:hypothetical protein